MISGKERLHLEKMLALGEEQGSDVFNITELLGYLHGLAITPEMIKPSEWLPVIFGGALPEFQSEKEAQASLDALFRIHNDFADAFHRKKLAFPYDLTDLEGWSPEEVEEWTHGLYRALRLRPECWFEEGPPLGREEKNHVVSLAAITAIAEPENVQTLFGKAPAPGKEGAEFWASLFAALPAAVQSLQNHAVQLSREGQSRHRENRHPVHPVSAPKTGRNDPCPCGSGKKHKKCCLRKGTA